MRHSVRPSEYPCDLMTRILFDVEKRRVAVQTYHIRPEWSRIKCNGDMMHTWMSYAATEASAAAARSHLCSIPSKSSQVTPPL